MSPWLLALILAGCGRDAVYGEPADAAALKREAVTFSAALPAGRHVVSGQVGEVCPMGCWFYLLVDSSLVYVQLDLESGFVIPRSSKGKQAVVRGELTGEGPERKLKAETVVLH